jgi:hypothetical protein
MDEPGQECGHDDRHRNNDQDDGGGSNDHERLYPAAWGLKNPEMTVIDGNRERPGRTACPSANAVTPGSAPARREYASVVVLVVLEDSVELDLSVVHQLLCCS